MNITNLTNFIVRTDTINAYMAEINKIPVLSGEEERELFVKYENEPSEEKKIQIRNEIISRNLRFNFAIAKRYSVGDNLPDLINVGSMAMLVAFDKYHWSEDVRFCTLASYYIRRDIRAYLEKENKLVRPKNSAKISPKVKKIENEFYLKNGRAPYPSEVIEALRKEGIDVRDELDIYGAKIERIDDSIGDDDFTIEDSQSFNERTASDNAYVEESETDDTRYRISQMMSVLDDRERKIIEMSFGYGFDREYKDKEIGDRIGLSSERVRQLKNGALKKMRQVHVSFE